MATKENFLSALEKIRKTESEKHKKVKFEQTVDLIINLKEIDLRKTQITSILTLPNKFRDRRVAAFLDKKSKIVDTITKPEFESFSSKSKTKRLLQEYDFFIASAKLMPAVATSFGRALGPSGKMPSPQLGILLNESDEEIEKMISKIDYICRFRVKEPSIKVAIGREKLSDGEIAENAATVYAGLFKQLPRGKDNVRSVLIKFTMGKPVKVVF